MNMLLYLGLGAAVLYVLHIRKEHAAALPGGAVLAPGGASAGSSSGGGGSSPGGGTVRIIPGGNFPGRRPRVTAERLSRG